MPGEAEVEDLHAAVLRHEDVLGLDVAVNDPLLVRGGEAVGHLRRDTERPAHRKRPPAERRAERFAFQQAR